jgi:hypothetical protein
VDEDVPDEVGPPGLKNQDAVGRIGAQSVGQSASGGAASDDYEVVSSRQVILFSLGWAW